MPRITTESLPTQLQMQSQLSPERVPHRRGDTLTADVAEHGPSERAPSGFRIRTARGRACDHACKRTCCLHVDMSEDNSFILRPTLTYRGVQDVGAASVDCTACDGSAVVAQSPRRLWKPTSSPSRCSAATHLPESPRAHHI